jgi:hypothetical protein
MFAILITERTQYYSQTYADLRTKPSQISNLTLLDGNDMIAQFTNLPTIRLWVNAAKPLMTSFH